MTGVYFINLMINGTVEGLLIALPALALTLVMGISRFPNAATGDTMTLAAYAGGVEHSSRFPIVNRAQFPGRDQEESVLAAVVSGDQLDIAPAPAANAL